MNHSFSNTFYFLIIQEKCKKEAGSKVGEIIVRRIDEANPMYKHS
jgi:hypothetical protein